MNHSYNLCIELYAELEIIIKLERDVLTLSVKKTINKASNINNHDQLIQPMEILPWENFKKLVVERKQVCLNGVSKCHMLEIFPRSLNLSRAVLSQMRYLQD